MYSLVSLLFGVYPVPAMHSLLVTLYVTEYYCKCYILHKISPTFLQMNVDPFELTSTMLTDPQHLDHMKHKNTSILTQLVILA